uniref:Uncharacterized protein n=1 Tax=Lotharella oceanica TaxID=641309 RepID=A0A7S2U507_9EUKA|mmetsp:Transcript_7791/g.15241  ORF Transcript_7791/g.15241 Transcript_7791/m.15241 type:complete len:220 (+) Transcript_7791:60-719(+)
MGASCLLTAVALATPHTVYPTSSKHVGGQYAATICSSSSSSSTNTIDSRSTNPKPAVAAAAAAAAALKVRMADVFPFSSFSSSSSSTATTSSSSSSSSEQYLVFADKRKASNYLRPEDQLNPKPGAITVLGNVGESCYGACQRIHKTCDPRQIQFVNTCEALLEHFPCEAGCGHQMGMEIPSYVVTSSERTYQQCLIADEVVSTCEAHHPVTRRLCACV